MSAYVNHGRFGGEVGPPEIVASSFATNGATAAPYVTVAAPSGVQEGDLLIGITALDYSSSNQLYNPTGFTFIDYFRAWDCQISAWWKYASAGQGSVDLPNTGGSGGTPASLDDLMGWLIAVRNVADASPIDAFLVSDQNGGGVPALPFDVTGVTTTVDNCMAIAAMSHDGSDGHPFAATSSGWTLGESQRSRPTSAASYTSGAWAYKLIESAGATGVCGFEGGSSDGNTGIMIAIAPAT